MLNRFKEIEDLFDELFPIPRSITGEGYRKSLDILCRYIPFQIKKISSGTQIFDWIVPREWKIEDAYLIDPEGNKILDFKKNNLSVVNYSGPIDEHIELESLNNNLHSLSSHPEWIPYVTSYYKKNWGFCMSHKQRLNLKPGKYHAVIKSSFVDGFVEYGTYLLKSTSKNKKKLVLISSYLCHPSLANNELSGPIVLSALFDRISKWEVRNFDYMFAINPETIGSICLLNEYGSLFLEDMQAGLILTCLGGDSPKLSYKKSRRGDSSMDKLLEHLSFEGEVNLREFDPSEGSDERQYCSSAFNLPVGQIAKTTYGSNPEYHTSADNKEFVRLENFLETIKKIENILKLHELIEPLVRVEPYCEIQLGRRDLYPNINSPLNWTLSSDLVKDDREQLKAIMYILSYSDGRHDIIDIARLSKIKLERICEYVLVLKKKELLK